MKGKKVIDVIINGTCYTMKFKPLRRLKKGAWFVIRPYQFPTESQVWIKLDYDRTTNRYCACRFSDTNDFRTFSADELVSTDFIF